MISALAPRLPQRNIRRQDSLPYSEFYRKVKHPRVGLQRKLNQIIQTYFKLTVIVNLVLAFSIWCLLFLLDVELSVLLAAISFFLAFVPELGIIVSVLLPLPIILLGDATPFGWDKGQMLLVYLLSSVGIKFLVGNILYSYLMGSNPVLGGSATDTVQEIQQTHPVVVLFVVVVAGEVWGSTGMLLSVPLVSLVRLVFAFWYLDPIHTENEHEALYEVTRKMTMQRGADGTESNSTRKRSSASNVRLLAFRESGDGTHEESDGNDEEQQGARTL